MRPYSLLALVISLLLTAAGWAEDPRPVDFAHDIVPLIKARCAECHTNGKKKGSLALDTREAILKARVVVPGKSSASELFMRITSSDPDERMPAKGKPLSPREIELLRAWIDQGLPWQPGFTFTSARYVAPLKPRRPVLPPARNGPDGEIRLLACLESSNPGLEAERKRGLTRCRDDRLVGGQAEEEAREIEDRRHRMTRRGAGIEVGRERDRDSRIDQRAGGGARRLAQEELRTGK